MKGAHMNKENLYCVTPDILYKIAEYAALHPEKHFCADELTDELGDFLSCCFLEDDRDGDPIWELDGVNEVVETCPHCDSENVWIGIDAVAQKYKAVCKSCGREIFLCDECMHSDDFTKCNWHKENGCSCCFRGRIEE